MKTRHATGQSSLPPRLTDRLAGAGLLLALLAAAAEALSGVGTRLGLWHYRTGLGILGAAGMSGAVAAIVSLIGGILSGHNRVAYRMAATGIIIGLTVTGIPWSWSRTGQQMPKIHDISTDTETPPQFVAILPMRAHAENPANYGGPEVAAQQRTAFPDIQPLVLPVKPEAAFDLALKAAKDMGWDVVSSSMREGRIEAIATTFWFGFKDDIVVRVSSVKEGSRIDVRSVSRVGKGDVGTNAKRIRTFVQKLEKAAG